MPRDSDKNNDSRGRRDRPGSGKGRVRKGRSGRRGVRRRNSPSAGLPERVKATASGVPMPGSPTARSRLARSLIPAVENLTPASATATIVRRAGTLATHRARAAIGRLLAVRHAVTMVKSVRSSRVKIVAVAKSARTRRAATARTLIATTVRRAGIATMHVRLDVFPTGNLATRSLIPREKAAARSGPTRRAAKVFVKTATVRVAIGRARPPRDGDRPRGDRPEENLAATRNSRAVRPIADRARISAPTAVIRSRGKSARIAASAIPVPPVTVRAISTSRALTGRATTAAARSVRDFRVRARIARGDRPFRERPKFDRPRRERDGDFGVVRNSTVPAKRDRNSAPGRPEGRTDWQEHPRSEAGDDRPRRENEDDSKIFAKRPAFGGRGAYRERQPEFDKRAPQPPSVKKSGERIAKVVARAGLASRRDAEEWITQGRVTVNGARHQFAGARRHCQRRHRRRRQGAAAARADAVVHVSQAARPHDHACRPRGAADGIRQSAGRPATADLGSARLDFNTEGLLLLTNDGGLARALELPDTGWLRRYRVRAHGEVTQAQLDELKKGVEVDGVKYGSIDATLERDQGANVWLVFAIREGKNREVRNVMAHLGLEVNRLIRVSYGPFQLGELAEGAVEEVKTRVLREQLGEKIATLAGADFNRPMPGEKSSEKSDDEASDAPRGKKPFKPAGKSALIADRKGRRVLVQRTGSEEARARNEEEANGYGPPRRAKRGYHGKRDLTPRDE